MSTLAKTPAQEVVFSVFPMFVCSRLGGAWVSLEDTSVGFQKVAFLTPLAWTMTGFRNIVKKGQGLESVLFAVAIVTGFARLFLVWKSGDLDVKKPDASGKNSKLQC